MKLRNKKTGEIVDIADLDFTSDDFAIWLSTTKYNSLAELNEEWEDYEATKEGWAIEANGGIFKISEYALPEAIIRAEEIGNCFETKEEAEQAVEKLRAWKRLKDNGFKVKHWKFTPDMKKIQGNYVKIEAEIPQILINEKYIDLLFGGEE